MHCATLISGGGCAPGSVRIVVASPDQDTVLALRAILQDDYEMVACVSRGDEALRVIERLHPEVVIAELGLAGIDGLELTRVVAEAHGETTVVIVSSEAGADDVRAALLAGG